MKITASTVLFLAVTGLLPAACALPSPVSLLHGRQGIKAQGLAFSDHDLDTATGAISTNGVDVDATGIGLQYEFFVEAANVGIQAGVERRQYDPNGVVGADATEISGGARYYFSQDEKLQPFVSLLFAYGLGLEYAGLPDSDGYWRFGAGGGAAFFFNKWIAVEALVHYEGFLADAETTIAPGVVRSDDLSGFAFILGLGFFF